MRKLDHIGTLACLKKARFSQCELYILAKYFILYSCSARRNYNGLYPGAIRRNGPSIERRKELKHIQYEAGNSLYICVKTRRARPRAHFQYASIHLVLFSSAYYLSSQLQSATQQQQQQMNYPRESRARNVIKLRTNAHSHPLLAPTLRCALSSRFASPFHA